MQDQSCSGGTLREGGVCIFLCGVMSRVLFLYHRVLFIELMPLPFPAFFLAQYEQGCDIFSTQRRVEYA